MNRFDFLQGKSIKVQFSLTYVLLSPSDSVSNKKKNYCHQIDLITRFKWCLTLNLVIMTLLYLCV